MWGNSFEEINTVQVRRNTEVLKNRFRFEPRTLEYLIRRSKRGEWLTKHETQMLCDAVAFEQSNSIEMARELDRTQAQVAQLQKVIDQQRDYIRGSYTKPSTAFRLMLRALKYWWLSR